MSVRAVRVSRRVITPEVKARPRAKDALQDGLRLIPVVTGHYLRGLSSSCVEHRELSRVSECEWISEDCLVEAVGGKGPAHSSVRLACEVWHREALAGLRDAKKKTTNVDPCVCSYWQSSCLRNIYIFQSL